jgi:hypothetical protein
LLSQVPASLAKQALLSAAATEAAEAAEAYAPEAAAGGGACARATAQFST